MQTEQQTEKKEQTGKRRHMKPRQVSLGHRQYAWLAQESIKYGVSISEIIRRAVDAYIDSK